MTNSLAQSHVESAHAIRDMMLDFQNGRNNLEISVSLRKQSLGFRLCLGVGFFICWFVYHKNSRVVTDFVNRRNLNIIEPPRGKTVLGLKCSKS